MKRLGSYHATNKIIYIHIPKTAGSTFRTVLSKNYCAKETFFIHDLYPETSLEYLHGISNVKFNNYSLIAGHGTQYLLPKASQFKSIVFLRDPLNQILSSYYHIKRSPFNYNHKKFKDISSLSEFYKYLKDNNGFNYQTMYLSRNENDFSERKRFLKIDEEEFNSALRLLQKIDYIFITENFNDALYVLKQDFQLRHLYYKLRNRTKKRSNDEKNTDLLLKIKQEQEWDYKLYDYAKKQYQILKSRFLPEIDQYVDKFIPKNKLYNQTLGRCNDIEELITNSIKSTFGFNDSWKIKPKYDQ